MKGWKYAEGNRVRFLGFVPDAEPEPERYLWLPEPGDEGTITNLAIIRGELKGYAVRFDRLQSDPNTEIRTSVAEDEIEAVSS